MWSIWRATWCLAAEIHPADHATRETLVDSVIEASLNLKAAGSEQEIEEVAADKGYHAAGTIELADELELADLHSRTAAAARSNVDRQAGEFRAALRVRQSPAGEARQEQEVAATAERTRGADVCPCVRHGRSTPQLVARSVKLENAT